MNQQHVDIAVWVLTGVITILVTAMWWSIRTWIKGVNHEISEMRKELTNVTNKNVGFEKDISRIDRFSDQLDKRTDSRMHDYSERLRGVEQTQAKCRNCTP